MPPRTKYVDYAGSSIAYQVVGDGPVDVLYLSGFVSHVDVRWESPAFAAFLNRLATFGRLILFDRRGSGASDPMPLDALPTWEEWAEDLRVVLDVVDSRRAAIVAIADAGPMAMMFAAMHPDRVSSLVLVNTSARLIADGDYEEGIPAEVAAAFAGVIEQSWGTPELAAVFAPGFADDRIELEWLAKIQRASATPRSATAQLRASLPVDLRAVLPTIQTPTLVVQSATAVLPPVAQGRYLARNIPGARLLELATSDITMYDGTDQTMAVIEQFITGATPTAPAQRVLATVVFTDIVGSTRAAAALGDHRWRQVLERHDARVRAQVEAHSGRLWKSTGDGALATFDAPGRAIRCVRALLGELADMDVTVRCGIHAGEVELRDGDVSGLAVHIAARVLEAAGDGGILVSRTVADLVAGSDLTLRDEGPRALKGVPGEWNLYRVV